MVKTASFYLTWFSLSGNGLTTPFSSFNNIADLAVKIRTHYYSTMKRILSIDLITCFKILHGLISLSSGDFSALFQTVLHVAIHINYFYPTLVLTVENIFSLLELSTCGTVYQTKLCVLAI